jgi:hypothetical protein
MHAFHNQRGIRVAHLRHRHDDDKGDYLLWCFARRTIAEEFANPEQMRVISRRSTAASCTRCSARVGA